jgi:hypothetical protein
MSNKACANAVLPRRYSEKSSERLSEVTLAGEAATLRNLYNFGTLRPKHDYGTCDSSRQDVSMDWHIKGVFETDRESACAQLHQSRQIADADFVVQVRLDEIGDAPNGCRREAMSALIRYVRTASAKSIDACYQSEAQRLRIHASGKATGLEFMSHVPR